MTLSGWKPTISLIHPPPPSQTKLKQYRAWKVPNISAEYMCPVVPRVPDFHLFRSMISRFQWLHILRFSRDSHVKISKYHKICSRIFGEAPFLCHLQHIQRNVGAWADIINQQRDARRKFGNNFCFHLRLREWKDNFSIMNPRAQQPIFL